MVGILKENVQVKKIVYCTEQTVVHIKLIGTLEQNIQLTNFIFSESCIVIYMRNTKECASGPSHIYI